jgi:hypothetical protein
LSSSSCDMYGIIVLRIARLKIIQNGAYDPIEPDTECYIQLLRKVK